MLFKKKLLPPKMRTAHHFDFDETLTKFHIDDWVTPPHTETCKELLKPRVLEIFRRIWQQGDYISIITNGTAYRVCYILEHAGFTKEEMKNLSIFAAGSRSSIQHGFKANTIKFLAKEWPDALYHYFYDDRAFFQQEVSALIPEFKVNGRMLTVIPVRLIADDISHLLYAEKISLRRKEQSELTIFPAYKEENKCAIL